MRRGSRDHIHLRVTKRCWIGARAHTFALHVADICNLAVFPNHLVAIHRLELHRLPESVLLTQLLPLSFFGGEALNDCVCSDVFGLRWIESPVLAKCEGTRESQNGKGPAQNRAPADAHGRLV